ncbi:hypothetical protein BGZ89_005614 [Linnemannia elongata]|nr:hypothetical protein BGZ89_005614 [Linnemannia elongata]
MTSVVTRFFESEKLVAKLGAHLDKKDILSCMRTCRTALTPCTHFLHHSLELNSITNYKELAESSEALKAWTRNVDHIQSISLVQITLDQYYPKELAVVAVVATVATIDRILHELAGLPSDTPATAIESTTSDLGGKRYQNDSTTTTTASVPATSMMVTPHVARMTLQPINPIPGLLLPPLTNLTHFRYRYSIIDHASFEILDKHADFQAVQLVGLLRQSPHLQVIHVHDILIRDKMALEKFTRILSAYTQLETLVLGIWVPDSWSDRVLAAIFFSCPQSLKILRIDYNNYLGESRRLSIAARTLEAPLLRQLPTLCNLVDFSLSGPYLPVVEDLLVILDYIPEVITLGLPRTRKPVTVDRVDADVIGRVAVVKCPKVRNLAQSSSPLDDTPATRRILTSINFDKCEVCSETIQKILCSCPLLETFDAAHFDNRESFLTLEDATSREWVSTKLTLLGLVIDLGDMNIPDLDWDDLTSEQQTCLRNLDAFYRQIGALTNLRRLTLQVLVSPADDSGEAGQYKRALVHSKRCFPGLLELEVPSYSRRCFPGLLTLGGGMKSKDRSWLGVLSGLNKLEHLHGSFNVSVSFDECLIGQAEVEWMAKHWSKLRSADFLCEDDALMLVSGVPPCLVWLKKQLTGLHILA